MDSEQRCLIKQAVQEALEWERSYLKSCPWCGFKTEGLPISQQISHLIGCGDKKIAESNPRKNTLN